jgi:hypothetical protein
MPQSYFYDFEGNTVGAGVAAVVIREGGCGKTMFFAGFGSCREGESGCGWRNIVLRRFSKVPVLKSTEFGSCKIETTEGVVISTPSATHLIGLPHQGSPLSFSYPSISAPLLRNVAHNPRQGEARLKTCMVGVNEQNIIYIGEKTY